MIRFLIKTSSFALVFLAAVSCRIEGLERNMLPVDGVKVSFEDLSCGNAWTKAVAEDFKLYFQEGDKISVYPQDGDEYMVYPIAPDRGVPYAAASFRVEGFSLKDGMYHSVYPAVLESCDPAAIVLPLTGQEQVENKSSAHLNAYDYCCASAEISDNSGYFSFSHKTAWLKISMPAGQGNTSFRQISVSADNGVADTLVLNVRNGAVTAEKDAGDTLVLKLGGESGLELELGDTLTAYICIPAGVYTNLTVRTLSAGGIPYTFTFTGEYELKSGFWYQLTIGKSDILPIEDIEDFGLYMCDENGLVKTWIPPVISYRRGVDQMSWYMGTDYTTFEIFRLGTGDYKSFRIGSGTLDEDTSYRMDIFTGNGPVCEDVDFEVVKRPAGSNTAWLLNRNLGLGCVIRLDD